MASSRTTQHSLTTKEEMKQLLSSSINLTPPPTTPSYSTLNASISTWTKKHNHHYQPSSSSSSSSSPPPPSTPPGHLTLEPSQTRLLETTLHQPTSVLHSTLFSAPLPLIGTGSISTIHSVPLLPNIAIKRARMTLGRRDPRPHGGFDLYRDAAMHLRVQTSFRDLRANGAVHVPGFVAYLWAEDVPEWVGEKEEANLLFMQRVPGLNGELKGAVDCLYGSAVAVGGEEEEENFLMRPILGGLADEDVSQSGVSGSGCFELCNDRMYDLGIDPGVLVRSLAEALAVLHWIARVDARGVEFVLAGPRHVNIGEEEKITGRWQGMNMPGRDVHLWMMDFNRVSVIPDVEDFLGMAVAAFVESPMRRSFPRPAGDDDYTWMEMKNWKVFEDVYLKKSFEIRGNLDDDLPCLFLDSVKEYYEELYKRWDAVDSEYCEYDFDYFD